MTLATLVDWTGTIVIGALCVGFVLLILLWLTDLICKRVAARLTRTYELYVVEYWMKVAERHGRAIPRKHDIERYLDEADKP